MSSIKNKNQYSVLLDTSFCIRLLSPKDIYHDNALKYFQYFLENGITMKMSTISIAEYCVNGTLDELPLRNLQMVPFNIHHATVAGRYAKVLFDERTSGRLTENRKVIANDVKLFAQAHVENDIKYFVTSDRRSCNAISCIASKESVSFEHFDITISPSERFGVLDM